MTSMAGGCFIACGFEENAFKFKIDDEITTRKYVGTPFLDEFKIKGDYEIATYKEEWGPVLYPLASTSDQFEKIKTFLKDSDQVDLKENPNRLDYLSEIYGKDKNL